MDVQKGGGPWKRRKIDLEKWELDLEKVGMSSYINYVRENTSYKNSCFGLFLYLQLYYKANLTQIFSGEFRLTFSNNFFVNYLPTDEVFFDTVNTFDVIRFYHILAL